MKTIGIKGIAIGLLLLLHTALFAQSDTDTIYTTIDTAIESDITITPVDEEVEPIRIAQAPDTPVFRAVPDSAIRSLQKRREFAYANDPAYWVNKNPKPDSNSWIDWLVGQPWFKYFILSLMIGLLLFAIIRIVLSNRLLIFKREGKAFKQEEQELLQQTNLSELIAEAETANNFRFALRYRYMKALQDMDQRQLIQLNAQSTNWDYVNRLGTHPLKKQFLLLTRAYEYVWYGEFEINKTQYDYWKREFQEFENALGQ